MQIVAITKCRLNRDAAQAVLCIADKEEIDEGTDELLMMKKRRVRGGGAAGEEVKASRKVLPINGNRNVRRPQSSGRLKREQSRARVLALVAHRHRRMQTRPSSPLRLVLYML